MTTHARHGSFAIVCTEDGTVVDTILFEGLDEWSGDAVFTDLAAPGSVIKARRFVDEVRRVGRAFGWELDFRAPDGATERLYVCGATAGQRLFAAGAPSRAAAASVFGSFAGVSDSAELVEASLAFDALAHDAVDREAWIYDELSRLNNDLASAHRELARKNAQLERLDAQKNLFLGMVSHDLRNPLAVVMCNAELILMEAGDALSVGLRDYVASIQATSAQMLNLVDGLLDLATIESGKMVLSPYSVDVGALVVAHATRIAPVAARRGIRIVVATDSDCFAEIDPARMEQALDNLVANAVKFSPDGGEVRVACRHVGDRIRISVADAGPGMAPDQVDRIFFPFERGREENKQGVGLGLAIAKHIVEAHGGHILVESAPGMGSTFQIDLPVVGPLRSTEMLQ